MTLGLLCWDVSKMVDMLLQAAQLSPVLCLPLVEAGCRCAQHRTAHIAVAGAWSRAVNHIRIVHTNSQGPGSRLLGQDGLHTNEAWGMGQALTSSNTTHFPVLAVSGVWLFVLLCASVCVCVYVSTSGGPQLGLSQSVWIKGAWKLQISVLWRGWAKSAPLPYFVRLNS